MKKHGLILGIALASMGCFAFGAIEMAMPSLFGGLHQALADSTDPTITVTALELTGGAPASSEVLSGHHSEITRTFQATKNEVDPHKECIEGTEEWRWKVEAVKWTPAGVDTGVFTAPTQAQLDAKKGAIQLAPNGDHCTMTIPANLWDLPGQWTVTVSANASCQVQGGRRVWGTAKTIDVPFTAWGVVLTIGAEGNETVAADDDYVMLKDGVGEYRQRGENAKPGKEDKHRQVFPFQVKARAHVAGGPTQLPGGQVEIEVSCPSKRIGFPQGKDNLDAEKTSLTLNQTGVRVPFPINGQDKSGAVGDAVVVAKWKDAQGAMVEVARRPGTVFYFEGTITVAAGGAYGLVEAPFRKWVKANDKLKISEFTTSNGNALDVSSTTRLRPAGCNLRAPAINRWQVGHVQNVLTIAHQHTQTFSDKWFDWGGLAKSGRRETFPQSETSVGSIPDNQLPILDNDSKLTTPLWAGGFEPVQAGDITHRNSDTPGAFQILKYDAPAGAINKDQSFCRYGYVITKASITDTFSIWSVVRDSDGRVVPVAQANWSLSVVLPGANDQKAVVGNPPAKVSPPVTDVGKVGLDYLNPEKTTPSKDKVVKVKP